MIFPIIIMSRFKTPLLVEAVDMSKAVMRCKASDLRYLSVRLLTALLMMSRSYILPGKQVIR
jgi:hypothetical protein